MTEIDLYRKKVSIALLRILHYLEADILIVERIELLHRVSELIRILGQLIEGRRPYRRS